MGDDGDVLADVSVVADIDGSDEQPENGQSQREFVRETDQDDVGDLPPTAFSPINFNITNRRIADIYSSFNDKELDTTPPFQRGYVWDRIKASRLIESVLLHVPLPLVYTAEEPGGREVVIDGQQRLMTFIGFLSGKFPKDNRPFRLTNLKILSHLNGKTYEEFDPSVKTAFRRYGVSIIRIDNTTHEDVKFEIFERLNTGAVTLSAQELRNCIYRGPFNDMIRKLAGLHQFTRVLALKDQPQRMADCEMILRFFAFNEKSYLNYNGKMKSFMNGFMKDFQSLSSERQDEWQNKFFLACDNTYTVFGDRAFRRFRAGDSKNVNGSWETAINRALFDCVMFWFARVEKRQIVASKDLLRERIIEAMVTDRAFSEAITLGTSDVSRVRVRFETVKHILDEVIHVPSNERRSFTLHEKQTLFDADPTCGICGQRVESIDDAEVDHAEGYAKGGSTTASNARLAHRYCNRARSRS